MANLFNSVRGLHPRKNAFNKSYRNTFTTSMGKLVPVYIQDCVPGTTIRCGASGLVRFQALLSPIMDNVNCYVHFWKIPYRLLDPDFPKWIGNELSDEEYDPPYFWGHNLSNELAVYPLKIDVWKDGGLLDFLGYPSGLKENSKVKLNVRPLQAYFLLLKHWYTNENFASEKLIAAIDDLLDAHGDCTTQLVEVYAQLFLLGSQDGLFNHAWAKDYFTSALPKVQAGDPVTLGIAGSAPVTVPVQDFAIGPKSGSIQINATSTGANAGNQRIVSVKSSSIPGNVVGPLQVSKDDSTNVNVDRISGQTVVPMNGTADLSEATAVTINELRVANALQVFKERLMRYGHRYVEYLKGFFNVTSSDARMQLPEWLGGGKMPINIADVEQTSATSNSSVSGANTPQGNLAGKGTGFAGGFAGFKTYCEEECIIIGLAYVQPKASYCQGVSRFLTKLNDRYDYFNPSFEHLGEQEIFSKELYVDKYSQGIEVFGYTPRYAEYRFHNDETHGQFKTSLNFWTLTRVFSSTPALNAQFIYTQPDALRRIFAVQKVNDDYIDNLLCDFHFNVQVVQPVSKYGTPMLLN